MFLFYVCCRFLFMEVLWALSCQGLYGSSGKPKTGNVATGIVSVQVQRRFNHPTHGNCGKVFYGCQHISRGWPVLFSKTHSSWQQKIVAFCLAFSHKQVPDHQEVWVDTTSDRSFNKYTYALNLQQICFVDLNRSNRSMIFPFLVTLQYMETVQVLFVVVWSIAGGVSSSKF